MPDHNRILDALMRASVFETVLQNRYIGTKRYSIEGAEALIPLLQEIVDRAGDIGAERIILAMAHRGRLNVMAHLLGTPIRNIFAEFEDVDPHSTLGGGDLQYHKGATGTYVTGSGKAMHISLVSNPSHLEAVNPVAMGRARAWLDRLRDRVQDRILLVNLHGNAAFAGQGIVSETLNLAGLDGYEVGGTVHVIVNNLIGFTTEPESLHTSPFCSDIVKRNSVPIFHVNGDEPDEVVRAGRMALEYRYAFHSDVVLDLICYRRHGHSEVDDPSITQPRLYALIQKHPVLWRAYATKVDSDASMLEKLADGIQIEYGEAHAQARKINVAPSLYALPSHWMGFVGGAYEHSFEVDTSVPIDRLRDITTKLTSWPEGFAIHPKAKRALELRRAMGMKKQPVDWGMAEALAFGSLLWDGVPVRLSGQDTRRGTFNHRHSVLIDIETEKSYCPSRTCIPTRPPSKSTILHFPKGRWLGLNMVTVATTRKLWSYGKRSSEILSTAPRSFSTSSYARARTNGGSCQAWSYSCRTGSKGKDRSIPALGSNDSFNSPPKIVSRSASRPHPRSSFICFGYKP